MTECTKCQGQATLYLCPRCIVELRHQLLGLPTVLTWLHDSAVGDTKMSDNAGRNNRTRAETVHYNPRARALLDEIYCTLGQWATELARTHKLHISPPVNWLRPPDQYKNGSKDYAMFMAGNVTRLAQDPDIAELCTSVGSFIRKAVNMINRHIPAQFCGPCPAIVTDHSSCVDCGGRRHDCATRLMAKRGATEVVCPACGSTHDVAKLLNHLLARAEHFRCTIAEMYVVLRMLDETVPLKTLYRWTYEGRLKPAGYLRADKKNIGISRHSEQDKPVYRVADARKQKTVKTEGNQRK
jgi:hypothetical protein